jgi:hypothetical protein
MFTYGVVQAEEDHLTQAVLEAQVRQDISWNTQDLPYHRHRSAQH